MEAKIDVQELIRAGAHFGHRSSRWNPKMRRFIYAKRNLIHIIDLRETVKGILRAERFLERVAVSGQDIVFVGAKRAAKEAIREEASRCGCSFVEDRWLGGTLTNFGTVLSRLDRLSELDLIVRDGTAGRYTKKEFAVLVREQRKLHRNLHGLRDLKKMPGALVVVDPRREHIAVAEARRKKVPVVALIDTDSDPENIDICVPGNDDAIQVVRIFLQRMADAVIRGRQKRAMAPPPSDKAPAAATSRSGPSAPPAPEAPTNGGEEAPAAPTPREKVS